MKKKTLILFCVILLMGASFFIFKNIFIQNIPSQTVPGTNTLQKPKEYVKIIVINSGEIYGTLMQDAGIPTTTRQAIFKATQDVYDFSNIKAGKNLFFTYDKKSDELFQIMYPINDLEELYINKDVATKTPDIWMARIEKIDYEIKLKTVKGEIASSLYEDALKLNVDEGTIIEFANIFEYAIDYAYDVHRGDTFQFVVEERYRDGRYVMPGRILSGKFIASANIYQAYYFEENEENKGYFDEKGNALQRMFLRAPVAFRYISSGFTTGLRYIQAFNISTGHRAIDYATVAGTPIRATADGTVIFAGWSRVGYGYLTSVRHNNTYSTNYAHQSRIIVKRGQRVKQGQIIGYVGSTGLSTGPHLHYELVKNGTKINPLKEILPPGKPIKNENMERFFQTIAPFQKMLE